ncbi:cytochrome b-c1 complex subunit 2, mitochondrial-like [Liolophura sinensis]|uniref:cytochrome b-c1 complex subunit 2, mitochondrial-like n=1 Tax=Liolophura sinensis TaxID=3198878 RepID=UPI00315972B3
MATKSASRGIIPGIRRRLYASQAASRAEQGESHLPKQDPKITKLPNGVLVASVENYSPLSRVSVVVNAGSRFEDGDNLGVTHCLRVAASLSTRNSSSFKIIRSLQQIGSNLTCSAGREYIHYSLDCTRDNVETGLGFMKDITTSPVFKPWELAEVQARLRVDRAVLETQPNVEVIELLHEAAFKRSLGCSLYAPSFMIGKYTSEQLQSYVSQFFTCDRLAVVGVGVDHDQLCAESSKFTPFNPTGNEGDPVLYLGGELRKNTDNPLVYAAVAVEGPSINGKDLLPSGVLQMIMGTGPYVKYSGGTSAAHLAQAASSATSQPFAISCINANYQTSGLFGFCAAAQSNDIGKVLKTAFSQFASVTKNGVTDQELARGKNQLKSAIHMQREDGGNLLFDMGEEALGEKALIRLSEVDKAIDAVSVSDVVNVAKRIVNGKATMAAVGNLKNTPCLSELYK